MCAQHPPGQAHMAAACSDPMHLHDPNESSKNNYQLSVTPVRWSIHANLDVTLMLVFVGDLRQNFDKTITKLRQNFDITQLKRTQKYPKHPLGPAKRHPRGILLSLGSHQPSLVEVLSQFGQSFVEDLRQRKALKQQQGYHGLTT